MHSLGIKTLRDSTILIDDKILLVGQEDRSIRRIGKTPLPLDDLLGARVSCPQNTECRRDACVPRDDLLGVRVSCPQNKECRRDACAPRYTILLSHQIHDHSIYENKNLDLVLSGHTHNGQLFPFNFIVNKVYDIGYGLQKRGDAYFYVSSGTWIWGPPMRIGTKSEIVVININ